MQGTEQARISGAASHETVMLRLGLASAGVLLINLALSLVSSSSWLSSPGGIPTLAASGLAGLLLLGTAGLGRPARCFRWLILCACIGDLAIQAVDWVRETQLPDYVMTDIALYSDLAGELLQYGEDPYTWDLTGAFELYQTTQVASTPKLDGANASDFSYPALHFLLVVPFQALGLPGAFLVSLLAHAGVLVLLFLASPGTVRPVILIPVMVGRSFVPLTLVSSMDIVWTAFLVGMVVAWSKPTLRAILFGLAAAFKQLPWLLIPFLVIHIWRDEDGTSPVRRIGRFALVSGVTFLVINGPYIAWHPTAWLRGVTLPFWDPLVFFSQGGLSSLSQVGFLALPKSYYLVASIVVFVLLLFCYWRHYYHVRNILWITPGILMWFSYRSLMSYWIYWIFPVLAVLVTSPAKRQIPGKRPSLKPTLAIAALGLGILSIVGFLLSSSPPTVEATSLASVSTEGGRVTRMHVTVSNRSGAILTPRFAVQQRQTGGNPLLWYVERGPLSLSPGESAVYSTFAGWPERGFAPQEAVQLVVTDAGGDYSLRAVGAIGPQPAVRLDLSGTRPPGVRR